MSSRTPSLASPLPPQTTPMHTKPLLPPEVRRELAAVELRDNAAGFELFDHLTDIRLMVENMPGDRFPHLLGLLGEAVTVIGEDEEAREVEEYLQSQAQKGAAFRERLEARIDEALEQGAREGEELRERLEARPWPDPTTVYRASPDSKPDADDIAARAATNREAAQLWVEANEAARKMEEYLQSQARPDDGMRYL